MASNASGSRLRLRSKGRWEAVSSAFALAGLVGLAGLSVPLTAGAPVFPLTAGTPVFGKDELIGKLIPITGDPLERRSVDLRIEFRKNSAEIGEGAVAQLRELGAALVSEALREVPIGVYGHTDTGGPADYNRELSERRAQAVATYLREHFALADARFREVRGYGEERPRPYLPPTAPAQRRVEIVTFHKLVAQPEPPTPESTASPAAQLAAGLIDTIPSGARLALRPLDPRETGLPREVGARLYESVLNAVVGAAAGRGITVLARERLHEVYGSLEELYQGDIGSMLHKARADVEIICKASPVAAGVALSCGAVDLVETITVAHAMAVFPLDRPPVPYDEEPDAPAEGPADQSDSGIVIIGGDSPARPESEPPAADTPTDEGTGEEKKKTGGIVVIE